MILRPATMEDVSALTKLGRDSFVAAFAHLYAPADLEAFLAENRVPQAVSRELAKPNCSYMLAEEDTGLVGYCSLYIGDSFSGRPDPQPQRPCILSQLYTAPKATGRGIGSALIEWAIGEAREQGCDAVQLSVWSENFAAQRFYARYGFEKVADIDFWVGNHRDDEFLYELDLGAS